MLTAALELVVGRPFSAVPLGRYSWLDDVRQARTAIEVRIVDAADEMNPTAANGILKELEEPPARTTLLLITHQPSRLLPTIRSRCRTLRLSPLGATDISNVLDSVGQAHDAADALTVLADGSAGSALRLLREDGLPLYATLKFLCRSACSLCRYLRSEWRAFSGATESRTTSSRP